MNHILPVLNSLNLPILSPEQFPVKLCQLPHKDNPKILYSQVTYICVIESNNPTELGLKIMKPVLYEDLGYGWFSGKFNLYSNQFNPVDETGIHKVVGFISL